ncbi:MAG: ABC transporter ATP-binding protein [Chloroflexota bacterium]
MNNSSPLVRADHLTKIYGKDETEVRALDDVSFTVYRGEFLSIMGPSGCGKSTLLNQLGALDKPTSGEVWVADENLAELRNVDGFRAKTVGFIFQLHNLLPTLTALENVEVPMIGYGGGRSKRRGKAAELLDMVGLGDRLSHLPNQLSGGQRQRIAVARALANDPALILADEPTGALDSQSSEELLKLLSQLNRSQGTTLIVVTHDQRVAQATQRILRMDDGQIVEDHRVQNPYEEDLRNLAHSHLGQALSHGQSGDVSILNAEEQEVLRQLLERISGVNQQPTP